MLGSGCPQAWAAACALLLAAPLLAPPQYPQWYLDRFGNDPASLADTAGDGIPDLWKGKTHAPRDAAGGFLPSAHLDRDGDGLTDLEEFWFGSDPRTASTRGDHWLDSEKRDHGLSAWAAHTSAVSFAQWQAWSGLSEAQWRDATRPLHDGFTGAGAALFGAPPPYPGGGGAVDLWLDYRTDRHALLTLGDALATNSLPLALGTGRVRLRIAYGGLATLTLDPAPGALADIPGATNGLWLCELRVSPFRDNTVVYHDGQAPEPPEGFESVDCVVILGAPAGTVHSLAPEPPARGGGDPPRWPAVTLEPHYVTHGTTLIEPQGWFCVSGSGCCAGNGCGWPTNGMIVELAGSPVGTLDTSLPIITRQEGWELFLAALPAHEATHTCQARSKDYTTYGTFAFRVRQCEALGLPEVRGAEHPLNPGHGPRHLPVTACGGVRCTCLGQSLWNVGFDHFWVNTRNLALIKTGPPYMDETNHCLGLIWKPGGSTNLLALIHDGGLT